MSGSLSPPPSESALQPPEASILSATDVSVFYKGIPAIQEVNLDIYNHEITGFIGPSGCGKSTLLRCFNRLNDLIPAAKVTGKIAFCNQDLYRLHPVEVRRRIGMVFQRPNPFPKSIYKNIAVGLQVNNYRGNIDERVEDSLRQVGLWDEVKHNLKKNALDLSGGQQQRLCIARAIALNPEVILMDEPTSALDPISVSRIEELLITMKQHYTVVIVTHNLKQAARVTDRVAFFNVYPSGEGTPVGRLVECAPTPILFTQPTHQVTWDYVTNGLNSLVRDP